MPDPILRVDALAVSYGGIRALRDVHCKVEKGEIVALIGANGAGKTTTLRAITGLARPTSGDILFDGKSLLGRSTPAIASLGIALVPEGRAIFPNLTVRENLDLGAWTQRRTPDWQATFQQVFDLFPRLKERLAQEGGTLSGGEQQMLAIGRALMAKPRLLLLDEPSLGLAPKLVGQIFDAIRAVNRAGTTILLVEQNTRMALEVAARAYVLEIGAVAKEGASAVLREDPAVQQAYLGG